MACRRKLQLGRQDSGRTKGRQESLEKFQNRQDEEDVVQNYQNFPETLQIWAIDSFSSVFF